MMRAIQDVYRFNAEIGYWVAPEFWNKGYCTEALKEVIRFGFEELKLHKIVARHMIHNLASGRVMQKAGMKLEAFLRQDVFKNGKFVDMAVYSIIKDSV